MIAPGQQLADWLHDTALTLMIGGIFPGKNCQLLRNLGFHVFTPDSTPQAILEFVNSL